MKKLTVIFILFMIMNSCSKQNSCHTPPKSIDSLSMNLDTLLSTPEKLEINGKIIQSKFFVSIVSDNRVIPDFFKHCERIFTIKLMDSKTNEGLFNNYTFEYYWYFSKDSKLSAEDNKVKYDTDNTTVSVINAPYLGDSDNKLIIKIKDKATNKYYLLKSIGSN